jgi:hypothetical protein
MVSVHSGHEVYIEQTFSALTNDRNLSISNLNGCDFALFSVLSMLRSYDQGTPSPSMLPILSLFAPPRFILARHRILTVWPAPRAQPCSRTTCVMPFFWLGARARDDCGSRLRVYA